MSAELELDYCDRCRGWIDPDESVVTTVALVPLTTRPVDGPAGIYHLACLPPVDGTWRVKSKGTLSGLRLRA
jgi:hypothetical protein